MLRLSLLPLLMVTLLVFEAAAPTKASTSTPSPAVATPPCQCVVDADLQLATLRCEGRDDADADAVDIGVIFRWNCSFFKVEVSNLDIGNLTADTFRATPRLTVVNLYSDYIKQIDREAFRPLKSLVDVDLSDNSLLTVHSDLFADNTLLTSVSLSDNPLVELDKNSPILKSESITSLDLSFCKLTTLTAAMFAGLPNLQRLDISNNNIQELSLTTLQPMPSLNTLKLGNNRWTCGCALKELLEYGTGNPFTMTRCFGSGRVMVYWSKKSAQKYCPEDGVAGVEEAAENYRSSSEESDVEESEEIKVLVEIPDTPRITSYKVDTFVGNLESRKEVIFTVLAVVVGFLMFVGVVVVVVRRVPMRGRYNNRGSIRMLLPNARGVACRQETSRLSKGDAVNGHLYEQILE